MAIFCFQVCGINPLARKIVRANSKATPKRITLEGSAEAADCFTSAAIRGKLDSLRWPNCAPVYRTCIGWRRKSNLPRPNRSASAGRGCITCKTSTSTFPATASSSSPGRADRAKSSLAFDTLYAEGQRQYIESLSTYARQFLHQLERPDVDLIEGLQPTISIDQRAGGHNPRSTVATVTEIYDYLRLLFARLGEPRCYQCGEPIRQQTPEQILDALMELSAGTRVMILAPLVRGRKGEHKDVFDEIRKAGFLRARVDGQVVDVGDPPALVGADARTTSKR